MYANINKLITKENMFINVVKSIGKTLSVCFEYTVLLRTFLMYCDPPSEYDEVDEEVIYSQESPNMVEVYR